MRLLCASAFAAWFLCVASSPAAPPLSIDAFGAVANDSTIAASLANGVAIFMALEAANQANSSSRTVLVPAGSTYTVLPHAPSTHLANVTLQIDGILVASTNISAWPRMPPPYHIDSTALDVLFFGDCTNVTVRGLGVVDGAGYDWWWYVLLGGDDERPNLLGMQHVTDVEVTGVTFRNSPAFHVYLSDALHVRVHDVTVWVDVDAQKDMLARKGLLTLGPRSDSVEGTPPAGIPTFPLNTDGIDISGRDVHIYNVNITNFDDAVAAKPLDAASGTTAGPCTEDWLVENSTVALGVGLTIGSVPPSVYTACVRNVTFARVTMRAPIKGIYIKPNPGNEGSGVIDGITYAHIFMEDALWWAIYVGVQQQTQPGNGSNTGCSFFFPLPGFTCPTQPLVPVTRLTLRNVTSVGSLLSPGLLRCANSSQGGAPCDGWAFSDVNFTSASGWPLGQNFLCEGAVAGTWLRTNPEPRCTDARVDQRNAAL